MPMKKEKLANGVRKYIRRQKMAIKEKAKNKEDEKRLVRELLNKFYGNRQ